MGLSERNASGEILRRHECGKEVRERQRMARKIPVWRTSCEERDAHQNDFWQHRRRSDEQWRLLDRARAELQDATKLVARAAKQRVERICRPEQPSSHTTCRVWREPLLWRAARDRPQDRRRTGSLRRTRRPRSTRAFCPREGRARGRAVQKNRYRQDKHRRDKD